MHSVATWQRCCNCSIIYYMHCVYAGNIVRLQHLKAGLLPSLWYNVLLAQLSFAAQHWSFVLPRASSLCFITSILGGTLYKELSAHGSMCHSSCNCVLAKPCKKLPDYFWRINAMHSPHYVIFAVSTAIPGKPQLNPLTSMRSRLALHLSCQKTAEH